MDCLLLVENLFICSSKLTGHYKAVNMQLASGEVIPLLPEITHLAQNISTLIRVVLNITPVIPQFISLYGR